MDRLCSQNLTIWEDHPELSGMSPGRAWNKDSRTGAISLQIARKLLLVYFFAHKFIWEPGAFHHPAGANLLFCSCFFKACLQEFHRIYSTHTLQPTCITTGCLWEYHPRMSPASPHLRYPCHSCYYKPRATNLQRREENRYLSQHFNFEDKDLPSCFQCL